jgi:hypothetical protein
MKIAKSTQLEKLLKEKAAIDEDTLSSFDEIPYTEVALFMVPILEIFFEIIDGDKTWNVSSIF